MTSSSDVRLAATPAWAASSAPATSASAPAARAACLAARPLASTPAPRAARPAERGTSPPSNGESYGLSCSPASIAAEPRRLGDRAAGSSPATAPRSSSANSSSSPRNARRMRNTTSTQRSGTRCSGVPVMTRMPNAATSASSGIAAHVVSSACSGAEIAKPIMPPDACIAATPAEGPGLPSAMCTIPSAPARNAVQPITILAVCAFLSGCRSSRKASRASRMGRAQDPTPKVPRISDVSPRPTGEPRPHQAAPAVMIAAARIARPAPSLRCALSRSRALSPNSLAMCPTPAASSIHSAARLASSQPTSITNGLRDARMLLARLRLGGVGVLRLR